MEGSFGTANLVMVSTDLRYPLSRRRLLEVANRWGFGRIISISISI